MKTYRSISLILAVLVCQPQNLYALPSNQKRNGCSVFKKNKPSTKKTKVNEPEDMIDSDEVQYEKSFVKNKSHLKGALSLAFVLSVASLAAASFFLGNRNKDPEELFKEYASLEEKYKKNGSSKELDNEIITSFGGWSSLDNGTCFVVSSDEFSQHCIRLVMSSEKFTPEQKAKIRFLLTPQKSGSNSKSNPTKIEKKEKNMNVNKLKSGLSGGSILEFYGTSNARKFCGKNEKIDGKEKDKKVDDKDETSKKEKDISKKEKTSDSNLSTKENPKKENENLNSGSIFVTENKKEEDKKKEDFSLDKDVIPVEVEENIKEESKTLDAISKEENIDADKDLEPKIVIIDPVEKLDTNYKEEPSIPLPSSDIIDPPVKVTDVPISKEEPVLAPVILNTHSSKELRKKRRKQMADNFLSENESITFTSENEKKINPEASVNSTDNKTMPQVNLEKEEYIASEVSVKENVQSNDEIKTDKNEKNDTIKEQENVDPPIAVSSISNEKSTKESSQVLSSSEIQESEDEELKIINIRSCFDSAKTGFGRVLTFERCINLGIIFDEINNNEISNYVNSVKKLVFVCALILSNIKTSFICGESNHPGEIDRRKVFSAVAYAFYLLMNKINECCEVDEKVGERILRELGPEKIKALTEFLIFCKKHVHYFDVELPFPVERISLVGDKRFEKPFEQVESIIKEEYDKRRAEEEKKKADEIKKAKEKIQPKNEQPEKSLFGKALGFFTSLWK